MRVAPALYEARARRIAEDQAQEDRGLALGAFRERQEVARRTQAWGVIARIDEITEDPYNVINMSPEDWAKTVGVSDGARAVIGLPPGTRRTPADVIGVVLKKAGMQIAAGDLEASGQAIGALIDGELGPKWREHGYDILLQANAVQGMGAMGDGAAAPAAAVGEGGEASMLDGEEAAGPLNLEGMLEAYGRKFVAKKELSAEQAMARFNQIHLPALQEIWRNPEASDDVKAQALVRTTEWAQEHDIAANAEEVAALAIGKERVAAGIKPVSEWGKALPQIISALPDPEWGFKEDGTPKEHWYDFDPVNRETFRRVELEGVPLAVAAEEVRVETRRAEEKAAGADVTGERLDLTRRGVEVREAAEARQRGRAAAGSRSAAGGVAKEMSAPEKRARAKAARKVVDEYEALFRAGWVDVPGGARKAGKTGGYTFEGKTYRGRRSNKKQQIWARPWDLLPQGMRDRRRLGAEDAETVLQGFGETSHFPFTNRGEGAAGEVPVGNSIEDLKKAYGG